MIIYTGTQPARAIVKNDEGRLTDFLPDASQKIRNHSPDGWNWGYGGSGPSQLALGLLLDVLPADAERMYHDFKWDVVARMPLNWTLTDEEILGWAKGDFGPDYFTAKWHLPH